MTTSLLKKDLVFNYSKVPSEYHSSLSIDDVITLYKGAFKGLETTGLNSIAIKQGSLESVFLAKYIFELGEEDNMYQLLDEHTSYHTLTPFLSATFNPETAQTFATCDSHHPNYGEKTIYQLTLKANRCIFDHHDTGGCNTSKELMILGVIFPEEITAVKNINDLENSELKYTNAQGTKRVRFFAEKDSNNTQVKDPSNWIKL